MTNNPDTRPCVPPVEGHFAMLRNGSIVRPSDIVASGIVQWNLDGSWSDCECHPLDIVSTISPEAMAFAADPHLFEMIASADKMATACDAVCDKAENLMIKAQAVLDYAEANLRARTIEAPPRDRRFFLALVKDDEERYAGRTFVSRMLGVDDIALFPGWGSSTKNLSKWAPLIPPSDELPAPFKELGESLGKLGKGV
jgi:hypothetical protein